MGDWFKQQLNIQTILMIVVLIVTWTKGAGTLALGWASVASDNAHAIGELITITKDQNARIEALAVRLQAVENFHLSLPEEMAKTFPRRTELALQLEAMKEQLAEMSRLVRRSIEQYPRR